jgi:hypothetical protein
VIRALYMILKTQTTAAPSLRCACDQDVSLTRDQNTRPPIDVSPGPPVVASPFSSPATAPTIAAQPSRFGLTVVSPDQYRAVQVTSPSSSAVRAWSRTGQSSADVAATSPGFSGSWPVHRIGC